MGCCFGKTKCKKDLTDHDEEAQGDYQIKGQNEPLIDEKDG